VVYLHSRGRFVMLTREDVMACVPRLRRFARQVTGDSDDAEEMISETVERAFRKLHLYRPTGEVYSWLCRMLQNRWIDLKRHEEVQRRADALQASPDLDKKSPTQVAALVLELVRQRCGELPSGFGDLVLAVGEEGLSYKEAAEHFDIPIRTVMSRLARARQALRDEFSLDNYE